MRSTGKEAKVETKTVPRKEKTNLALTKTIQFLIDVAYNRERRG